jgi:hypothetical protein
MIMATRSTSLRRALVLCGLVAAGALAGDADAGDGAQFSRDCTRTYVNKQVGNDEQWSITWSLYEDATGNVFKLDGSAPSFIECKLVGEDGSNELFDCYGADLCSGPPCAGSQWTAIGSNVAIPISFFFPPGVDPQNPLAGCTVVE